MSSSVSRARAPRRLRTRAVPLFAVLFAILLLHGISGGVDLACERLNAPAAASALGQTVRTFAGTSAACASTVAVAAKVRDGCDDCGAATDEMWFPLAGNGSDALLAALLLALAWVSVPRSGRSAGYARVRRAARIRDGSALLALTCVSRT